MSDLDLPVLDAADFRSVDRRDGFVTDLNAALSRWGFVAITGHGVDTGLLADAYGVAEAFFDQPADFKSSYERPEIGRQRGYTGFGVEHAKDRDVHDLKEFWQVGRELGADHPLVASGTMPDNVMPKSPEAFGSVFRRLYAALDAFANELLEAIALGIGLDADDLLDAVRDGNSVLRVIHYPPIRDSDPTGAVRAAAHEDINMLTVLPSSTQPGLELLDRDGTWRPIVTPPDVMLCDTGDLMQHLTGGKLPATTHRVVNPPGSANVARYSMPFFVHPKPDWVVQPVEGDKPPITAGAFLEKRLRENRVL